MSKEYRLVAQWPKQMMRAPKRWPKRNRKAAQKALLDLVEGRDEEKYTFYIGSDITIESREVTDWAFDEEATMEGYTE